MESPLAEPINGTLPKQFADMLFDIVNHLTQFESSPPHTIQRLAELILRPHAHYKALAPYLHAVDRVVQVTSGTSIYPLPPAIPDMSSMQINGEDAKDPAVSVAWSNPTTAALGTDEALGGALLTPIPWLTRRRSSEGSQEAPGAQIHSESTETIDGPNGMGSIETVSVSVNGVPSTGHTRGVTQGELLRQEQRAGVVPVSQLSRAQEATQEGRLAADEDEDEEVRDEEDEEETPHARGPEEIGIDDTGLQPATTSHLSEGQGTQGIDVEAAVGRKHEDDEQKKEADTDAEGDAEAKSPSAESVGSKREADQDLESDAHKKIREEEEEEEKGNQGEEKSDGKEDDTQVPATEKEDGDAGSELKTEEKSKNSDDKMDTD